MDFRKIIQVKNIKAMFLAFILMAFIPVTLPAQYNYLDIEFKNGADSIITINTIQKITFSDTEMIVNYKSGSTEPNLISAIRKAFLTNDNAVIDEITIQGNKVSVYPNPAEDVLNFSNLPDMQFNILIYDVFGNESLSTNINSDSGGIDVSALAPGTYIININNQFIKFIKL